MKKENVDFQFWAEYPAACCGDFRSFASDSCQSLMTLKLQKSLTSKLQKPCF